MTGLAGVAALTPAGLSTGAAFDINAVEHRARMTLGEAAALRQWPSAYQRGYAISGVAAPLGFGAAIAQASA